MRWLWLALGVLLAAPAIVLGQGTNVDPPAGSVWTYLGSTFGASWALPGTASMGWVPSNAVLVGLVTGAPQVYRAGFYSPGDGGSGVYTFSPVNCVILGGDNGSQVQPNTTGCWYLEAQEVYDIRQWGLTSNPVTFYVDPGGTDTIGGRDNFCVVLAKKCQTLNHAAAMANLISVAGGDAVVLMANGTWNESVSQNGQLPGCGNTKANPLTIAAMGPCRLQFVGAGAGATTWNGNASYCYTLQASNFGIVSIKNMTIKSTGSVCQLSFAVQLGGQAFSAGGIEWGASNNVQVWAQDTGSIVFLSGNDTITGSANSFAMVSGGANIQDIGGLFKWTAPLIGSLSFPNGFIRTALGGSFQDNNVTGHNFTNSITGPPLVVDSNSVFANQTGIALSALLPAGTFPSMMRGGARVIPEPPSTISTPSSGCGASCTTTIISQGPRSGYVTIVPGGAGIGSAGGLNVAQGIALTQDAGGQGPCLAGGNSTGAGNWSIGAVFQTTVPSVVAGPPPAQAFTINWSNNAVNLAAGVSYVLTFVCSDS